VAEPSPAHPVVLFDGVCNVCNWSVNFVIDRDPHARFRFASLQSSTARTLVEGLGGTIPEGDPDGIIVVDGDRLYEKSSAMLRIAHYMSGAWPLLAALRIIPRPLRDALYRWFAARRYRWFGKSDTCRIPTPELRARFLA
jgi:predicted DCC family thiol-disulfide oxidoreductase YuxK